MAKKIKGSDIVKIGVGFVIGAAGAEATEHLVIPAVKKGIENRKQKKSASANVDVNIGNGATDETENQK